MGRSQRQRTHGLQVRDAKTGGSEVDAELQRLRQRIAELEAAGFERRLSEAALRADEEQYRAIQEQMPRMYFTLDADGTVLAVNAYGAEALGYRPPELIGESVLKVFHPEDRRAVSERLQASLADSGRVTSWRFRKIRKDATQLWVQEAVRVVEEDGRPIVLVVCDDITTQVEAEEKLGSYKDQLRALASEATLAEERERRRIAEGLHDHIGQALVGIKMQLGALQAAAEDDDQRRSLGTIRDQLEKVVRQTRSLTFELSCPVLYRLGLRAALRDLGEGLEEESGVRFLFAGDPGPTLLAEDQKVLVFRCARELFTNAVKHARAQTVKVSIDCAGDRLLIAIEDDGIGFDASKPRSGQTAASGFGLFAISERLRHLGGSLEIRTAAGAGTRALITLPLAPPDEARDGSRSGGWAVNEVAR